MDTPSALSTDLVNAIRNCLAAGKFKEAMELPDDNKYAAALQDNSQDLIPFLVEQIKEDTIITWPALQLCCERLLITAAERSTPGEVLLELMEQTENAKNDAQFIAVLLPLQIAVRRMSATNRSLEWCFNSLQSYVEKLPRPEELGFSEKEKLLMDCDTNVRRILKVYSELPTFYSYFVNREKSKTTDESPSKDIVTCFLIDLLDKPMALLDMEHARKSKSQSRIIVEKLFADIVSLEPNLLRFVQYVNVKCYPNLKSNRDGVYEDPTDVVFLLDEKLTKTSLAVLYYLMFYEKLSVPDLPQVYNLQYICHEILPLAASLLHSKENMLHLKGLLLGCALIDLLRPQVPAQILSARCHPEFAKALTHIAVYSPIEELRKTAVTLLKKYIMRFSSQGRYLIITNLLSIVEHYGLIGYLITVYKDCLVEALKSGGHDLQFFRGSYLRYVLLKICFLHHGSETDLIEIADQLISSLNLLRFLVLTDTGNITGVRGSLKDIEKSFLKPLREGIDISKAHYEVKLLDLSDKKPESDFPSVSVTIAGMTSDNLPVENKREVVNSALNALHLIDSLLCRLQECVQINNA